MTKLETTISTILHQLNPKLSQATWESNRRYFNQMIRLSNELKIREPCQELYDAFIADDNGSRERHSRHIYCVRLIDAATGTQAIDEHGALLNEPTLPDETTVEEYFRSYTFPAKTDINIDYLIVKAGIEMKYLMLTDSTTGQYKHSWIDIRRFFNKAGYTHYNEALMQRYLEEISLQRVNGFMKEWKWKISRKAAHVLIEVADTGSFHWRILHKRISCATLEAEYIRQQYIRLLKHKNLSMSTIGLHDYVFRKFMEFAEIKTQGDLITLTPNIIQKAVRKFADICNRRSMSTILPILRTILKSFHTDGLIKDRKSVV